MAWGVLLCGSAAAADRLDAIPNRLLIADSDDRRLAIFEVDGDRLIDKHFRDRKAGRLGLLCWERIVALVPAVSQREIVQFNFISGRRWAGRFGGDGVNDVARRGYQFSVAKYRIEEELSLADSAYRPTPRRGTLDWTLVHEMGHLICLRTGAIELFSQRFDGDTAPQPARREAPDDYAADGSPLLEGDFVTSLAENCRGLR